jgi:hypothetical protein
MVILYTTRFNIQKFYFLTTQYVPVFRMDLRTVAVYVHSINTLVFITDAESVFCAVRTGSLTKRDYVSSLKG